MHSSCHCCCQQRCWKHFQRCIWGQKKQAKLAPSLSAAPLSPPASMAVLAAPLQSFCNSCCATCINCAYIVCYCSICFCITCPGISCCIYPPVSISPLSCPHYPAQAAAHVIPFRCAKHFAPINLLKHSPVCRSKHSPICYQAAATAVALIPDSSSRWGSSLYFPSHYSKGFCAWQNRLIQKYKS